MAGKKYAFIIPQIKCPFCRRTLPKKYLLLEQRIADVKRELEARIMHPITEKQKKERERKLKAELKRLRKERIKFLKNLEGDR